MFFGIELGSCSTVLKRQLETFLIRMETLLVHVTCAVQ